MTDEKRNPPPLPPPPPPPPPPPSAHPRKDDRPPTRTPTPKFLAGTVSTQQVVILDAESVGRKAHASVVTSFHSDDIDQQRHVYLSFYRPVKPLLQDGPSCGVVALAMAAMMLKEEQVTEDQIMELCINRGYSKQGELFSVESMAELAEEVYSRSTTLLDVRESGNDEILNYLAHGDVLLVPYDADKNHGPCMKRGHKAHWAVLTGFFLVVPSECEPILTAHNSIRPDKEIPGLFHLGSQLLPSDLDIPIVIQKRTHVFVYGHQGKSRHAGVWPLEKLVDSISNLVELDPERSKEADSYVLPRNSIVDDLCHKLVVVHNTQVS